MTYDAKQLGAQLRRCTVCGIDRLMTAPRDVCIRCRSQRSPVADAEILSDPEGKTMTRAKKDCAS